jgi:leucyl-tRNA synthetase
MNYVRNTTSAIGSAEGAQQKKLAKGKATTFDPKKDKKLTIYCAKNWPAWQAKYIDVITKQLDTLGLVDTKELGKSIDKAEMKKAMPFVQMLKKKLDGGEGREQVLERKMAFEEEEVLVKMVPMLKASVTKLVEVVVVSVGESGKEGTVVGNGDKVEGLGLAAQGAEPGNPGFEFTNV